MDKNFLTAFILPDEWEVVGYKLKPFSVRKYINLIAINSPYVSNLIPSALDTVKFLKWCASDSSSIVSFPQNSLFDRIAYWRLSSDPKFHLYTIKCIMNYIKEYSSAPTYRIVRKDNTSEDLVIEKSSVPELLMLTSVCMAKLNMKEDDVLNAPLRKLGWYVAAIATMEGADVRILETDESKLLLEKEELIQYEKQEVERVKKAMANGKIEKRKIKQRFN